MDSRRLRPQNLICMSLMSLCRTVTELALTSLPNYQACTPLERGRRHVRLSLQASGLAGGEGAWPLTTDRQPFATDVEHPPTIVAFG